MDRLSNEEILNRINTHFGEVILNSYETYDVLNIEIHPLSLLDVLKYLKEDDTLNFHFLTDICGIHFPDNKDKEIGVNYFLHNMMTNTRIRVKAFLPADNPVIHSSISLWPSANWMERETFDFYGVLFDGHPNLMRILNVEDMDYHPMLKQYPLEDGTRTDKDDKMFGR